MHHHERKFKDAATGMHHAGQGAASAKLCCNMHLFERILTQLLYYAHIAVRIAPKNFLFILYFLSAHKCATLLFIVLDNLYATVGTHSADKMKTKLDALRSMFLYLYARPLTIVLFSFSRCVSFFFFFLYNHKTERRLAFVT